MFSCSGMFPDIPECSGMFHVPGFIDAAKFPEGIVYLWSTEIRHHCLVVSMHILNNSNTLIV